MTTWVKWSPRWAPHVKGEYTKQASLDLDGKPVKQMRAVCVFKFPNGKLCNTSWQATCNCNGTRTRIQGFARQHLHGGINRVPRVVATGSLRGKP